MSGFLHRPDPKKVTRRHACRLPGHVLPAWAWFANAHSPGRGLVGLFRRYVKGTLWECRCGEQWLLDDHMNGLTCGYGSTVWWRRSEFNDHDIFAEQLGGTMWERHLQYQEIRT